LRLRHIKIAGFKSFADPVTVSLERPFTGIVGPNGCGKSNIIDAVRWVLGEARLSELRGSSSMKELIFAGSSNRKPLGRASVELLLTNEDGRVKGPWGEYAEITVKRVVTSDGQSQYFINQQQVRRRDVLDIFMGTGLGPKSYAIISQGMISSFIKAKPEELRVYLEEAAGVSLYRERRRETEQLIVQTQSNLERVQDALAIKLEEHERLRGEAELVDRWQALNDEKRQAESLWYFIQYEDARKAANELAAKRARAEAELEEHKRRIEEADRSIRLTQLDIAPLEAAAQQASAELRQAEKHLTLQESEERRREERLRVIATALAESEAEHKRKSERLSRLEEVQAKGRESLEDASDRVDILEDEIEGREDSVERARDQVNTDRGALSAAQSSLAVEIRELEAARAGAAEAEKESRSLESRLERLRESARKIVAPSEDELNAARDRHEELTDTLDTLNESFDMTQRAAREARAEADAAKEAYFTGLSYQKECLAKVETLEQRSEETLGSEQLADFEQAQGLEGLRRLHETITVQEDWVNAADAILGCRTDSILLRMIQSAVYTEHRPPAPLSFIETRAEYTVPAGVPHPGWCALREKIQTSDAAVGRALDEWLSGLWCVDSIREGLSLREALGPGERLITPQGDTVSRAGIEYWVKGAGEHRTLAERMALERAQAALIEAEETLDRLSNRRDTLEGAAQSAESELKTVSARRDVVRREESEAKLALRVLEEKWDVWRQRNADMQRDRSELEKEHKASLERIEEAAGILATREEAFEEAEKKVHAAKLRADRSADTLRLAEIQLNEKRRELAVLRTSLEAMSRAQTDGVQTLSDLREDCERELARQEKLRQEDAALRHIKETAVLGEALEKFKLAEAKAQKASQALEEKRALQQASMEQLKTEQAEILPKTEAIGQMRVDEQNKLSLREQFSERLTELGADRIALAAALEQDKAKASGVRNRVLKLMAEIEALGPINHAAKAHLEAIEQMLKTTREQVADLEAAISTLQEAIRKIDHETRMTMRDTFETVKANFAATFSHLFSGGTATLELVGDDILNAGLEVHAQPPGKKNSTLRLLSGGEQALTATALVFALFKLNPAPFCLLDEVDAPLDEANQARLAGMCRAQSAETQFLMITHHRITMEYAQALVGVTMREPGVSRVVSVDIEEAARMAQ